jgi:hypothetical protein
MMAKRDLVSDWRIVLEPHSDVEGGGTLDILKGDEDDAAVMLETLAEGIRRSGVVPRSLDWQNESCAAVLGRRGKLSFRMRVDCFERETETGMTSGAGWLRAKRVEDG